MKLIGKTTLTRCITFYFLFSGLLIAASDNIRFGHISTENGLSSNTVFSIHKDQFGFIWIGTMSGLNRFDGYEIKTFHPDPHDSLSLSHNKVTAISHDSQGNLWVGTDGGGLDRFSHNDQVFINFNHQPDQPGSLSDNHVKALFYDSQGNLWIGTKNGLNRLNEGSNDFEVFRSGMTAGLTEDNIMCFTEFPAGVLWIGFVNGYLVRHEIGTDQFTPVRLDQLHPNRQKNNLITGLSYNALDSTIWFGFFPHGFRRYDPADNTLKTFMVTSLDSNMASINGPYSIAVDSDGIVWIGSVFGLTRFDPELEEYTFYRTDQNNMYSISDNVISCLVFDDQKTMWLGTSGKGVNRYDPDLVRFQNFQHNSDDDNSLPSPRVYGMAEDHSGYIWAGTIEGGASRFSPDGTRFSRLHSGYSDPDAWHYNSVMKIVIGHDDLVWLGTWLSGLFAFDPETNELQHFRNYPRDSTSISGNNILSLFEDSQENIWVGTDENGLNRLNRKTGK